MLEGRTVILGVSGGIAAYKTASLASMLVKQQADVHVIMTAHAVNFINPITFETLTGNKCIVDTFDRNFQHNVEHVSLGKRADVMMVAPATANVLGKMANGIADDMLTTTFLACRCPILLAPAMNTAMYQNPIVQDNMKKLKGYGCEIIGAASGWLACGDSGEGKMPEPGVLYSYIEKEIACKKDLAGRKVLVTAGPTREALDPVRYITNHSSGKMGYALAKAAMLRGAEVTLVTGPSSIEPPPFVNVIPVVTAEDMFQAVTGHFEDQDIVIKAAAVADYRPASVKNEKVKKKEERFMLPMERTRDILKYLGEHKRSNQFLCGFSMETEHMISNSREKLAKKHLDMIVANNLKEAGAGFQADTNVVTLITQEEEISLGLMSKEEVAHSILDKILSNL
ncbi:MAG: bifunctional phosphopantothenoylcysteine decarboxylase/phosphopantothenate--cysteine ligase CoaBC [Ruminococcus sp.]|jgi:phosphopantothenoylcysteine decarboxylase/phosphopantothenate--cysteine ligase